MIYYLKLVNGEHYVIERPHIKALLDTIKDAKTYNDGWLDVYIPVVRKSVKIDSNKIVSISEDY